jgi:hypothetical protein
VIQSYSAETKRACCDETNDVEERVKMSLLYLFLIENPGKSENARKTAENRNYIITYTISSWRYHQKATETYALGREKCLI